MFKKIKIRNSEKLHKRAKKIIPYGAQTYSKGVKAFSDGVSPKFLEKGLVNLERHVNNLKNHYGLPVVVGINGFSFDTDKEREILQNKSNEPEVLKKIIL